jgi:hypothetical protein
MHPVHPQGLKVIRGEGRQVFAVENQSGRVVYMSVSPARYSFDDYRVVFVEASRFLGLWRAEPQSVHAEDSHGEPDTWRKHRKFDLAAEGFSRGANDPVPLPDVSCYAGEEGRAGVVPNPYVSFFNGITRTIWLLSEGFLGFPVLCAMPGARVLQGAAGAAGYGLVAVDLASKPPSAV